MTLDRLMVAWLAVVLEATLLSALVLRRHYSASLVFPLYVLAVLGPDMLFSAWPERFFTWENYLFKEIVHNLLKFALALELAYRTFRAFPGALTTARVVLLVLLVVIGVVTLAAPLPARDPADIDIEWHARILNGTIWVFTGIAVVVLWYRVPVHALHKAILVGLVPYLLIFSSWMRALVEMGWNDARPYWRFHTLAYVALLFYWNRVAWSRSLAPTMAVGEPARSAGRA
jgi:hypothetical protein